MTRLHRRRVAGHDMPIRDINLLTIEQRNRLTEIEDAIAGEDMHLEVLGLHPLMDDIVGRVECPYDGYRTKDLTTISLFVFNRAPKLKLRAESIAAECAMRRDSSYGL